MALTNTVSLLRKESVPIIRLYDWVLSSLIKATIRSNSSSIESRPRVGHGGRYYYKKKRHRKIDSMRQRIFYETTMSIELASELRTRLNENGFKKLPVEIHLDVGNNGDTKEIIKEVLGMVTGSGFAAVTKTDSYGATKVADSHSR